MRVSNSNLLYGDVVLVVPIWTLAQVVADYVPGPVDFLKVDVEGFEREVLAGADWYSFRAPGRGHRSDRAKVR